LNDLDEFITYVDLPEFAKDVIKFPNPKENKLGFCNDPDNEELKSRIDDEDREHIDYYFPLMERKGTVFADTVNKTKHPELLQNH
jgi:hypothetical protein